MNTRRRKMLMMGQQEDPTYRLAAERDPALPAVHGEDGPSPPSEAGRPPARFVSLDAYRGCIMALLAAEGFGIASFASLPESAPVWQERDYGFWQALAFHFEHPAWESKFGLMGVSGWDLIQPAFMFMVGVAMPFSYSRRQTFGHSAWRRFGHAVWRAMVLVLLGVFLYSLRDERTNWIFPNVLAQIGLGYVFAYTLLGRKAGIQIAAIVGILAGYWWFFWQYSIPEGHDLAAVNASAAQGEVYEGPFASWSKNANAAHAFDVQFLNLLRNPSAADLAAAGATRNAGDWAAPWLVTSFFSNSQPFVFNSGGYQTLNFVPSVATTLLGILCGQLLMSRRPPWAKVGWLVGAGALCMVFGLLAGEYLCPIVKRIWTPSWVLFSGAYVIWLLALFYVLFDILPLKRLAFPLVVIGMNSLAIYLMGELIHDWTARKIVHIHLSGILETVFGTGATADDMYGRLITSSSVLAVFWLIAWWMYRQRYFVRV